MMDIFSREQNSNQWDKLVFNVEDIYHRFPIGRMQEKESITPTSAFLKKMYRATYIPLHLRRYIRKLAYQTNLDLGWYQDFAHYWSNILGGRSFWGVQDFYFLTNLYHVRFQDNQIPDTDDASLHLAAWQRPELLYQLMHLVYKEISFDYAMLIKEIFKHNQNMQTFLEFGCGTAPITASLLDFFSSKKSVKIYISDIQTIAFHYAAYRFLHFKNITPLLLVPETDFKLPDTEPLDVITCITVFEHLNQPLETVRSFHARLKTGGLLIFDYIKSEGDGMDTVQGVRERDAVLDFIASYFDILRGDLAQREDIGIIFARKK